MHVLKSLRFIISNSNQSSLILPHYRKILILGSGPSLDQINLLDMQNYDAIIAINHAVLCEQLSESHNKVFWFSGDHGRLEELCHTIAKMPLKKRIFACYYPSKLAPVSRLCSMSNIEIQKVVVPILSHVKMNIFPESPPYYKRLSNVSHAIKSYFAHDNAGLPAIGDSSLLSALLFASKSCNNIDLLGCDLSDGRSNLANVASAGKSRISTSNARSRYLYLVNELNLHGVNISNLSWQDLQNA